MSKGDFRQAFAGSGLIGLLLLATLGEGGGSALGLLVWHGGLVALLVGVLLVPRTNGADGGTIPAEVALAFALFLLLFALGAMRAPYGYGAFLVSIELASCVAVALLAASAGRGLFTRLIRPLQIGAALHGLYVVYQAVALDQDRPAGTFLNPNHFGIWAVAVLLLSWGARENRKSRSAAIASLLLSLPVVAGLVLCGSRGAFLGLLLGGGWLLRRRLAAVPAGWRKPAIVAALLLVMLMGSRQWSRLQDYDPFRYYRLKIWRASLGAVVDDPWWGSGPGQFAGAAANLRFPDEEAPFRYDRAFSKTHSDLLRVPAELGVPAALALLLVLALGLRELRRRRLAGRPDPGADGLLAALLALAVQAIVDNPSRWPATYLLASALIGSLLSVPAERRRIGGSLRAAFAGLLLLVFAVGEVGPFLAWQRTIDLGRGGRLTESDYRQLRSASRLNRIHPGYALRLAQYLAGRGEAWELETYARARESAERAVRLQPADAAYRKGLARIEALGCRTLFRDEACRERTRTLYREAGSLSRYDPSIPLELAMFLSDLGDPAGARRAAERALALEPEAALPRLVLARTFLEDGSTAGARRAGELVVEATEKAREWERWSGDAYGGRLLGLDPEIVGRLQREVAAALESDPAIRIEPAKMR